MKGDYHAQTVGPTEGPPAFKRFLYWVVPVIGNLGTGADGAVHEEVSFEPAKQVLVSSAWTSGRNSVIGSLAMKRLPRRIQFSLGAMALTALLQPAALNAATGCGVIKPDSTDAVAAAPDHHKVILENDAVRVLEARVPLHSYEPPHRHPWPSVFFEQTSGLSEPWKTVNIRWSEGGSSKGFASSDRDRHNLLVEIKTVDCQPAPSADLPSTDAVKIHDPNIKVVLENDYVRVLSVLIPPGGKEPWHTHTWPAVVVYFSLPPSQRFLKDGTKTARPELKELQVTYDPRSQPLHSVENLGTVPYQAYRVELKPTTAIPRAR